jgi:phosphonate transport system substrate-binding protein
MLGIVYQDEAKQLPAAVAFVQYLADETGYIFQLQPFPTYTDLLSSMQTGTVLMAWMQPLTYLYASKNGYAEAVIQTNNFGVYAYGSQFLIRSDSALTPYFDTVENTNTADAPVAFTQLNGLRPCMVNETSISSYVVAQGLLKGVGINVLTPAFQQNPTSVIRALYIGGICDFGVTYSISGDPRTSPAVENDIPDVLSKVIVLWRSDPIIPTLSLTYNPNIPADIKTKLTLGVLTFAGLPDGLKTLSLMTDYEIEQVRPIDGNIYGSLEPVVEMSGINLEDYLGY